MIPWQLSLIPVILYSSKQLVHLKLRQFLLRYRCLFLYCHRPNNIRWSITQPQLSETIVSNVWEIVEEKDWMNSYLIASITIEIDTESIPKLILNYLVSKHFGKREMEEKTFFSLCLPLSACICNWGKKKRCFFNWIENPLRQKKVCSVQQP